MTSPEFFVRCHVCSGEVYNWNQSISYTLTDKAAHQAGQTIYLSCGCVIDFPQWKIDLSTGMCTIEDYAGKIFINFYDEEFIGEGDEF